MRKLHHIKELPYTKKTQKEMEVLRMPQVCILSLYGNGETKEAIAIYFFRGYKVVHMDYSKETTSRIIQTKKTYKEAQRAFRYYVEKFGRFTFND